MCKPFVACSCDEIRGGEPFIWQGSLFGYIQHHSQAITTIIYLKMTSWSASSTWQRIIPRLEPGAVRSFGSCGFLTLESLPRRPNGAPRLNDNILSIEDVNRVLWFSHFGIFTEATNWRNGTGWFSPLKIHRASTPEFGVDARFPGHQTPATYRTTRVDLWTCMEPCIKVMLPRGWTFPKRVPENVLGSKGVRRDTDHITQRKLCVLPRNGAITIYPMHFKVWGQDHFLVFND